MHRRVLHWFDPERARREELEADAALLERKLRRAIDANFDAARTGSLPLTLYAQDPLSARAALRARRKLPARVVMTVHYNLSEALEMAERGWTRPDGRLWNHARALEEQVLPRLDHLIFVSDFMRDVVLRRLPELAAARHSVIPNFCAATSGLSGPPADLIAIGTLESRKNQRFLLEVLAACRQRGRIYRCTMVGHGPDAGCLRLQAAALGVLEQVEFVGHRTGAAALIPSHRVLVHGASMENMPLALIEALACGRPVLAAPVGGIPEIVRHGREGFHWPLDDVETAASLLIELLESPDLWARMSEQARQRYARHFSPQALAPRWFATLQGATGKMARQQGFKSAVS